MIVRAVSDRSVIQGLPERPAAAAPAGSSQCDALFVLSALGVGGSERKVTRIASSLAGDSTRVALCALGPPYTLASSLHREIPVSLLDRRRRLSWQTLRALRDVMKTHRPRTVIAVDLFALLYVSMARRLAGLRAARVVALVNTTSFVRLRDRAFMAGYAPLLRRCDLIVFGSLRQREQWLRRYRLHGAPSCVIHNGIDPQRFGAGAGAQREAARQRCGIPAARVVIGNVGRLAPEKNQLALVRAVAALAARGLDGHLLLVGDGAMREPLRHEAARLGIADRLTLAGEVDDVRDLLAAMDLFALPSTSVETFSNAALEAMSMSLPVVLSDIGGAREMVETGREGYIVPAGDQEALQAKLQALCVDAAARHAMGAAARARIDRDFTFARMVGAYRAIIASAATGAGELPIAAR